MPEFDAPAFSSRKISTLCREPLGIAAGMRSGDALGIMVKRLRLRAQCSGDRRHVSRQGGVLIKERMGYRDTKPTLKSAALGLPAFKVQ